MLNNRPRYEPVAWWYTRKKIGRGLRECYQPPDSRISCEMVRAYVAQVGLAQAKATAQAAGMTGSEEREAVQCLEKKI
jgi:hypothetical protein